MAIDDGISFVAGVIIDVDADDVDVVDVVDIDDVVDDDVYDDIRDVA